MRFRLTYIYILYFEYIKKEEKERDNKKNTDADTTCGNKFPSVTHKACVPHCQ